MECSSRGLIGQVAEVGKNPLDDQKIKRIFVLDDGLRRTYVSERLHVSRAGGEVKNIEIILIPNQPARSGRRIASIGRILRADPFDRYGRRRLTLSGGRQCKRNVAVCAGDHGNQSAVLACRGNQGKEQLRLRHEDQDDVDSQRNDEQDLDELCRSQRSR